MHNTHASHNTHVPRRPGDQVVLVDDTRIRQLESSYPNAPQSRSTRRIKIGTEGVIIATRPTIDQSVLVKFKGCRFHIALHREHVEPKV